MKCDCPLDGEENLGDMSDACPCGFRTGDDVTVLGDDSEFGHPLRMAKGEVLEKHQHWSNGPGWRTESGWDVSCSDIEATVTDEAVNEAIASILKEK